MTELSDEALGEWVRRLADPRARPAALEAILRSESADAQHYIARELDATTADCRPFIPLPGKRLIERIIDVAPPQWVFEHLSRFFEPPAPDGEALAPRALRFGAPAVIGYLAFVDRRPLDPRWFGCLWATYAGIKVSRDHHGDPFARDGRYEIRKNIERVLLRLLDARTGAERSAGLDALCTLAMRALPGVEMLARLQAEYRDADGLRALHLHLLATAGSTLRQLSAAHVLYDDAHAEDVDRAYAALEPLSELNVAMLQALADAAAMNEPRARRLLSRAARRGSFVAIDALGKLGDDIVPLIEAKVARGEFPLDLVRRCRPAQIRAWAEAVYRAWVQREVWDPAATLERYRAVLHALPYLGEVDPLACASPPSVDFRSYGGDARCNEKSQQAAFLIHFEALDSSAPQGWAKSLAYNPDLHIVGDWIYVSWISDGDEPDLRAFAPLHERQPIVEVINLSQRQFTNDLDSRDARSMCLKPIPGPVPEAFRDRLLWERFTALGFDLCAKDAAEVVTRREDET